MANKKYIKFPSHGINTGLTSIMYQVVDFIKNPYPENFFNYTYINTKYELKNIYRDDSRIDQVREISKPLPPKLIAIYEIPDGFKTEDTGNGLTPMYHYMSQYLDTSLRNYMPVYNDPYGISLHTSDIRIRINLGLSFELASKSDQLSFTSSLYNNFKFHNGYRFRNFRAFYQASNMMVDIMKKALYDSPEIQHDEEKFDQYLQNNSAIDGKYGGFRVMMNENKTKKFYYIERIYEQIYFQFTEEPEVSEGEQNGQIFSKYTVRIPGFFEIYIPITYIMVIPEIVNSKSFNDFLIAKNEPILGNTFQIIDIPEKDKLDSTRLHSRITPDSKYNTVYQETDINTTSTEESFNLFDWLNDTVDKSEDLEAFIYYMHDKPYSEVFDDEHIRFEMFEHKYLVDKDYMTIEDNYDLTIKNCFTSMTYTMRIVASHNKMKTIRRLYSQYKQQIDEQETIEGG